MVASQVVVAYPKCGELSVMNENITSIPQILEAAAHGNPEQLASELRRLNLHMNNVTRITGLQCFAHLVDLNLSGNRLTSMEGLDALCSLKTLDLACNYLTAVGGIGRLRRLESLKLAYNRIADLSGFEELFAPTRSVFNCKPSGSTLASAGKFRASTKHRESSDGIVTVGATQHDGTVSVLRVVDLTSNSVDNVAQLSHLAGGAGTLRVLHFSDSFGQHNNPICHNPTYRDAVARVLPQLEMLDHGDFGAYTQRRDREGRSRTGSISASPHGLTPSPQAERETRGRSAAGSRRSRSASPVAILPLDSEDDSDGYYQNEHTTRHENHSTVKRYHERQRTFEKVSAYLRGMDNAQGIAAVPLTVETRASPVMIASRYHTPAAGEAIPHEADHHHRQQQRFLPEEGRRRAISTRDVGTAFDDDIIQRLEQQLEAARVDYARLEEKVQESHVTVAAMQELSAELRRHLEDGNAANVALRNEITAVERERSALKKELGERIIAYEDAIKTQADTASGMSGRVNQLQKELNEVQSDKGHLECRLKLFEDEKQLLEERLNGEITRKKQLEDGVQAMKKEVDAVFGDLQRSKEETSAAEKRAKALQEQVECVSNERESLQGQVDWYEGRVKEMSESARSQNDELINRHNSQMQVLGEQWTQHDAALRAQLSNQRHAVDMMRRLAQGYQVAAEVDEEEATTRIDLLHAYSMSLFVDVVAPFLFLYTEHAAVSEARAANATQRVRSTEDEVFTMHEKLLSRQVEHEKELTNLETAIREKLLREREARDMHAACCQTDVTFTPIEVFPENTRTDAANNNIQRHDDRSRRPVSRSTARSYAAVDDDGRDSLVTVNDGLVADVADLHTENERLEAALQDATNEVAALQQDLEDHRRRERDFHGDYDNLQRECDHLSRQAKNLRGSLSEKDERIAYLEEKVDSKRSDVAGLAKELEDSAKEVTRLSSKCRDLEMQSTETTMATRRAAELQQVVVQLGQTVQTYQGQNQALENALKQSRAVEEEFRGRVREYEATLAKVSDAARAYQGRAERAETQLAAQREKLKSFLE